MKFIDAIQMVIRIGVIEETETKDEVVFKLVDGSTMRFKSEFHHEIPELNKIYNPEPNIYFDM